MGWHFLSFIIYLSKYNINKIKIPWLILNLIPTEIWICTVKEIEKAKLFLKMLREYNVQNYLSGYIIFKNSVIYILINNVLGKKKKKNQIYFSAKK